jgi:hypothetical protein
MEVGTAVRTAFNSKISALTYNGSAIEVFDEFQVYGQNSPYVVLSTQTEQQIANDDAFIWNCTILLKVVAWGSLIVGKKAAEDLGALILSNVLSLRGEQINTVSGFDITGVELQSTNTLPIPTDERVYINKLYRFGLTVQQF